MDFAGQQRNPTKHLLGLVFVVLMHIGIVYALMSGLGRKAIQVITRPLDAKIIEEIKVTPPPEPPKPPPKEPPPKTAPPPPPAYIPPPEVKVDVPPPPNVITAVMSEKPPEPPAPIVREPVAEAPAPAPPPPPAPKPAVRRGAAIVLNKDECTPQYPRKALQDGISGEGEALIDVATNGSAAKVVIISANPRGVFDREVIRAFMTCRFPPDSTEYKVTYPFGFKLND
ncbi:MAG: TonB family protein [Burkholderiales bacterium]